MVMFTICLNVNIIAGNFRSVGTWLPATITVVQDDNSCNLFYDNGETEDNVAPANIRILKSGGDENTLTEG